MHLLYSASQRSRLRPALQDTNTGVLYGATSEPFVASSSSDQSPSSLTLGGTDATFLLTFQLPALPPAGAVTLLQLFNNDDINSLLFVINANSVEKVNGPGTNSANNVSGFISVSWSYDVFDSGTGNDTFVFSNQDMPDGPQPMLFVPKLFGGSWVTVAVSVSSTSNMTVYARDSVSSSNMSLGASITAMPPTT